jgi:hypothetical protein
VVVGGIVLPCPWNFAVPAIAVILFLWSLAESGAENERREAQRISLEAKIDDLTAAVRDQKAAAEPDSAKREALEISAALRRFVELRQSQQPTASWAHFIGPENWQRFFFGSNYKFIEDSMQQYDREFRGRVAAVTKSLGGDAELENMNTAPRPAWPTELRTISDRLADLAERSG